MRVQTCVLAASAVLSVALVAPSADAHNWSCWIQPDRTVRSYNTASRSSQAAAAINEWDVDTILAVPAQSSHTDISVYDGNYGATGWAGLASIESSSGCTVLHGHARVNLYYAGSYTSNGIRGIFCQEVGHLFGLDHSNDGGCMGGGYFYSINTYYNVVSHNISDIQTKYSGVPLAPAAGDGAAIENGTDRRAARAFWHDRPRSVGDALQRADAVVLARATGVVPGRDLVVPVTGLDRGEDRIPTERVAFEVSKVLSGSIGSSFNLFHTGNSDFEVEEAPAFEVGGESVLFLQRRSDGAYIVIAPEGRYDVKDGRLEPAAEVGFATFLKGASVDALMTDIDEALRARVTR